MTDYFTYWDERMILGLLSVMHKLNTLTLKQYRLTARKTYDLTYEADEEFWNFDEYD